MSLCFAVSCDLCLTHPGLVCGAESNKGPESERPQVLSWVQVTEGPYHHKMPTSRQPDPS